MYATVTDRSRLRQGDVLDGLFFPRYSLTKLYPLQRRTEAGVFEFADQALLNVRTRHGVVISQCCEFTEDRRSAFSIARLLPLHSMELTYSLWGVNVAELVPLRKSWFRGKIAKGITEELRAANLIDPDADRNEAVNVYLFEPDGVHLTEHHIADFTQVFSISMSEQKAILESKLLELDVEHRRQFQRKLAYFYGRRAE